jgi:adenylylsulfate kinase
MNCMIKSKSEYLVKGEEPNTGPSLFIGRYQIFHDGHKTLIQTVLDEGKDVVIALRDGKTDSRNPFTIEQRVKMIKDKFPDAVMYPEKGHITIVAIPDISEVVFGRGVGWSVRKIKLDDEIESISATKLREKLKHETN